MSRIDEIVELIQQEARERKDCVDYVSALYTVSLEIRIKIMHIMDHLRGKERETRFS